MRLRRIIPRFSLRTLVVFLLLVTSGAGLWWHWEPWYQERSFSSPYPHPYPLLARFADSGRVVEVVTGLFYMADDKPHDVILEDRRTYVTSTGEYSVTKPVLGVNGLKPDEHGYVPYARFIDLRFGNRLSPDGTRELQLWSESGEAVLYSLRGKPALWIVDRAAQLKLHRLDPGVVWADVFTLAACSFSDDGERVVAAGGAAIVIYRRRRPEWWWGVFWLWEFWLTTAFAGVFVWSVWRDRKALKVVARQQGTSG